MTPEAKAAASADAATRLTAALAPYLGLTERELAMVIASALDNTPTIAADLTLGARLRDPADPLLDQALERANSESVRIFSSYTDALRAALTEGSGE